MCDLEFNTLFIKEDHKERWYPQTVSQYRNSIHLYGKHEDIYLIQSNFAYNMQYIEYIEKQLRELCLSSVLKTMLYKSYIIIGMSVIESLFTNLLKSTGNWNMCEWKSVARIQSNPKKVNEKNIKIETEILEQTDFYEMRMDLDSMIKKVESKNLLSIDHNVFPVLKSLRTLRNRVHLQQGEYPTDHDFNNFGDKEVQMIRRILYTILTCNEFCNNNIYGFLQTNLFVRC